MEARLMFGKRWPEVSQEAIRLRARLLVIDDSEFPYLELFQRDGYNVTKWDDVENLRELESAKYDVILLDLHGVGRSQSAEQGLGILKHLRLAAPSQIVLAYSDADWPLKYQDFFRLADAVLSKSKDYVEFKRAVDHAIEKRFSLDFYVERIATVAELDPAMGNELARKARKAVLSGKPRVLEKFLNETGIDQQKLATAMAVAQTAIGVLQLTLQLAGK
jgi:CheY-like chemotaxis protein